MPCLWISYPSQLYLHREEICGTWILFQCEGVGFPILSPLSNPHLEWSPTCGVCELQLKNVNKKNTNVRCTSWLYMACIHENSLQD